MAWSTPPTAVNGELTADLLNAYRDLLSDLDTRMRLHGMDSSVVLGNLIGARYGVKVTNSSQAVPKQTDQLIYWDAEVYDDDGFWTVTQAARVTIPEDGHYEVKTSAVYEGDADGNMRGLEIYIDGANHDPDRVANVGAAFQTTTRCSDEFYLTAGKEIYVRAKHSADKQLTINQALLVVRRVAKTA